MEASDVSLVERARQGNHDAFNELLARHRSRAFSWAQRLARDRHLAEDIVQESLIRAFLKLGTITDMTKFLPWLRMIVRNQAMMKLRRGGPNKRELSFTALSAKTENGDNDWRDLDTVLHHYVKRSETNRNYDAPGGTFDTDLPETMSELIRVLGPKERQIFEKHFYGQLSPGEIADHYDTNVNNVHKALSRIRKKLDDQKSELDIRARIRMHVDAVGSKSVMLPKPAIQNEPLLHPDLGYPNGIYHALRNGGKPVTMAEVMGFTGYAFLLNVRKQTISVASTVVWDWDTFLANGLLNLGYHSRYVDYQHFKNAPSSKHKSDNLLFALDMIREAVDQGMPALLNSGIRYEVALVYGYDDESQQLYLADSTSAQAVPYSRLYNGSAAADTRVSRELYAYVCDGEAGTAKDNPDGSLQLLRLLERIIRHADGGDATFLPCVNGLRAYEEWIEAFVAGTIDPLGNASNLLFYGVCRDHAAMFWKEILDRREEEWLQLRNGGAVIKALREAEGRYEAVSASFLCLRELFPFPHGGDPHDPAHVREAIGLLQAAKREESAAIDQLRVAKEELTKAKSREHLTDIVHIPLSPFYSFGGNRPKPREEREQPDHYETQAVMLTCRNLKRSIRFYSTLLGIELHPEELDGPIAVFPLLEGKQLILMDKRLDLLHTDWQPVLYIRAPDIDTAYAEAKRQNWPIVYELDKGGVYTDFFIAADRDGHPLMVGSHSLRCSSVAERIQKHPLLPMASSISLAVKDVLAARQAYARLFGEDNVERIAGFANKFASTPASVRLQLAADDRDRAYAFLRSTGIPVTSFPDICGDERPQWIIQDPDGHRIAITVRERHTVLHR